jgi:transposase InsO family protein
VRARLRTLAGERRRFGYRRLLILLRREEIAINHKRLFRLYREERPTVRKRGGRKRALGTRAPLTMPQAPNQRWSLDFAADVLSDGRRLRILVVVDDYSRECLALVADRSLTGQSPLLWRRMGYAMDHDNVVSLCRPDDRTEDSGTGRARCWRRQSKPRSRRSPPLMPLWSMM